MLDYISIINVKKIYFFLFIALAGTQEVPSPSHRRLPQVLAPCGRLFPSSSGKTTNQPEI